MTKTFPLKLMSNCRVLIILYLSYFHLNNRQIQKFPARIDSKEELCDIVTRIISHLSLQHTACNYPLADYAVYIPNLPTKLYNDTRVKEGEFSVYRLPNRVTSAVGTTFFSKIIKIITKFRCPFYFGWIVMTNRSRKYKCWGYGSTEN